jgi:hypothetical protein
MKHLKNLFLAGTALALMVASAEAQSAFKTNKPFEQIHKKAQVEKLDAGSQLVLVCKDSDTVTLINIKDKKQAIQMCTEGTMIECRDCRKKYKVTWTNPTGKGPGPRHTMQIVNAKGEPCMFLARIK